jgi:hypothetical protein
MGLLDELTGGAQAQQGYQGFVDRYDRGPPYAGISDDEALQRHDELAQQSTPDDYQQAASDSFGNLSDEERAQLGQQLASQAQQQGFDSPELGGAMRGNPSSMGSLAGLLHQQAPGMRGQLLCGGGGGQAGRERSRESWPLPPAGSSARPVPARRRTAEGRRTRPSGHSNACEN